MLWMRLSLAAGGTSSCEITSPCSSLDKQPFAIHSMPILIWKVLKSGPCSHVDDLQGWFEGCFPSKLVVQEQISAIPGAWWAAGGSLQGITLPSWPPQTKRKAQVKEKYFLQQFLQSLWCLEWCRMSPAHNIYEAPLCSQGVHVEPVKELELQVMHGKSQRNHSPTSPLNLKGLLPSLLSFRGDYFQ